MGNGKSILAAPARLLRRWGCDLRARGQGIDLVYTWVDGSEPGFRRRMEHHRAAEPSRDDVFVAGERRFRDSDELRYSLRSVEAYAPWVNRIFLVTDRQVPAWLRLDHPRLRRVDHAEIFTDPANLPTFNSAAIEIHLHRIRGLSRHYLYLNDDMFFGRPVRREDFLVASGRPRIWVEPWMLPTSRREGDLVSRWLAYNHELLQTLFSQPGFASLAHVPVLYDRRAVARVQALWPARFARTAAHRFRTDEMVMPHVLYAHCRAANGEGELAVVQPENYQFVMFQPPLERAQAALGEVSRLRPQFFTINDDWDDEPGAKDQTLRDFLKDYFPIPSSFEQ